FKQAPVLKQGWGLQKLHFEQLKKRPAHEEPYPFSQRVLTTLKRIVDVLPLDPKQARHVLGDGYIEGRSYYKSAPTIEQIRGWVKDSLEIRLNKDQSAWDKHGIIHHPGFEGVVLPFFDQSKASTKVFKSKLHWNKKGIHIVPTEEEL
uniref:polymorphic toxin type 50 domain-containing protein n=1 Tax=Helicobacter vulpis TaxID=2316076 RepID=UPI0013CE2BCC